MNRPGYIKVLTPAERLECIKLGAAMACFDAGTTPATITKTAQNLFSNGADTLGRIILLTSVLGGIPLGAAAHAVHKHINKQDTKERELTEQLKQYRGATGGMERGLAENTQPNM
jgi:hypothetical protein